MYKIPVTIIIPTYNRHIATRRAIFSIKNQSVLPAKVVVVDDGSKEPFNISDGDAGNLPVELIRHDYNKGPAAARNTGMRESRTDWITFLDSDDMLTPDSLLPRWKNVQDGIGAGASNKTIFGCSWIDADPDLAPIGIRRPRPGTNAADFASGCWFSPGTCVMLHRGQALDVDYQDEDLRRYEDVDWFLGLGLRGFDFVPSNVVGAVIVRHRGGHAAAEHSAEYLLSKWQSRLSYSEWRRLRAYTNLELAANDYHASRYVRSALRLIRSFLAFPRSSLHLSPGWDKEILEDYSKLRLSELAFD